MMLHNLPRQLTPFVGRKTEIAEIKQLLSQTDCRLLSLVGPSGMGKTRLSLEVARQITQYFVDGVFFVALQPLTSSDTVISAIATAIRFESYDEDKNLEEQLIDYLGNKTILLLMDNFEHVLRGADLLERILIQSSNVKIMVTSREPLKLQQEWIHHVVGMTYPENIESQDIDEDSAIQLFIERAQQFRRNFNVTNELPHIIRICQLVGGMPLGIELAVAWLKTLSCKEIASEIEKNSDLLTAQLHNVEERHRSIQAVFDATWQMLTSAEQTIFMRLSVFQGTPTRRAIQTVTGASLLTVSQLVDKALLVLNDNNRYQIHALLRQYAYEKLEASADCETIRQTHSNYFLAFLHERQQDIYGRRQIEAVEEITLDFENIRTAWHWAVDNKNYERIGLAVETLCTYLHFRSRWKEESYLLDIAIHKLAPDDDKHDAVWGMLIARNYSNSDQPTEDLALALEIAKQHEDQGEIGLALHLMGHWYGKNQGSQEAIEYMEQSIPYFEAVNNHYHIASSYGFAAVHHRLLGDYQTSLSYNQKNLSMSRTMGNIDGQTFATSEQAQTMFILGELEQARYYRQEALLLAEQVGRLWNIASLKLSLAVFHSLGVDGDLEAAHEYLQRAEHFSEHRYWKILLASVKSLIAAIEEQYDDTFDFSKEAPDLVTYDDGFPIFMWNKLAIACGQDDLATVEEYTHSLLHRYWERRIIPYLMLGIFFSAWIAYRKGNFVDATQLMALVCTFDGSMTGWLKLWSLADRMHADLEEQLRQMHFQVAWEQGCKLDWEVVCQDLVYNDNYPTHSNGDAVLAHAVTINASLTEPLSKRELQVLFKIAEGYSNREIADQLFVGVSTVKKHITHIYGKLDVESRTQAILRAQELTLV